MAVHPAGFLASRRRTGRPDREMVENRPATSTTPPIRPSAVATPPDPSARPPVPSIGAAAMAAMAALARLNWPGRPIRMACRCPSASTRSDPSTSAATTGRAKAQRSHAHPPPPVNAMRPPQAGQPTASSCHTWPAPTQQTSGAVAAAKTTIGSSALATTTVPVAPGAARARAANEVRHRSASIRTSAMRSSWSRDRLSRTTTSGAASVIRRPR